MTAFPTRSRLSHPSARNDNLASIRYIGAVIVNDSRGRYYEPGSGRGFMPGARVTF